MPKTLPIIATGHDWTEVFVPEFGTLVDTRKSHEENTMKLKEFFQRYPEEPKSYWKRTLPNLVSEWGKYFN